MNNIWKILAYAAVAFGILILISFLAGFLAWLWGKLLIGFIFAVVIYIIYKIENKPTGDGFIVWWGLGFSALMVAIDLVSMALATFSWLIFLALGIGVIIWAYIKWGKR